MTIKTFKTLSIATVITLLTFSAMPASAATSQEDVQACRIAMTSQSNIDMNDYRLRFERSKGYRVRTVYLKAISKSGGESFQFECHMKRETVTALKTDNTVMLAAR